MPYLSDIKHPDKNVEEKVNFFADYYRFINSRVGYIKQFRLDTPESIINKIYWQLLTNYYKSKPYVTNYLGQLTKLDIETIGKIVLQTRKVRLLQKLTEEEKPFNTIKQIGINT